MTPGAQLTPIKRQSIPDAVFSQLREQIVGGHMAPGTELPPERQLASALGVNRQAVREALKRLEQARLVSIQHGGGTRVLDFRDTAGTELLALLLVAPGGRVRTDVVRSVLEMRQALAPDIARLAAERADKAKCDSLSDITERMRAAHGDLPTLQDLSMQFWGVLVACSGNVAYRLVFNSLRETYAPIRQVLVHVMEKELTSLALYEGISSAVRAKRSGAAEKSAKTLMQRSTRPLMKLMDSLEIVGEIP
jgi:DNA-binding FadR family transcriptional regulator